MNMSASPLSSLADPSVEPAQMSLKANKLFYVAKLQPFLQLSVINMLFTYMTLGGYSFKAVSEIVTYMARYTAFSKNIRAVYKPEPLGLFKTVAPALGVGFIAACMLQWSVIAKNYPVFFLGVIVLYGAVKAGLFLARRHHLERLQVGSAKAILRLPLLDYMKCMLRRAALNVVTFGYAIPQSDIEKWNLVMRHVEVGSAKIASRASATNLRWIHMVSFYIPFLLCVVFLMMSAQAAIPVTDGGSPNATAESFMMLLFYLALFGGFIGRVWYNAALRAECLRTLTLGPLRFKTVVTGKELLRNRLVNTIIVVGTAGLAYPYMLHRNLSLWCRTTLISGPVEAIFLSQGVKK